MIATNYLLGTDAIIPAELMPLLNKCSDPIDGEALAAEWSLAGGPTLISQLVDIGALVEVGSEFDIRERVLDMEWRWPAEARWFHFSTQAQTFIGDPAQERSSWFRRIAAADTPPSPFKDHGAVTKRLSSPKFDTEQFDSVLLRRRTCRSFRDDAMPFQTFSTLLGAVWGSQHIVRDPPFGESLLKTSPSGGARHPIEVYVLATRVEDVPPGLYHYNVREHGLSLLASRIDPETLVAICSGQKWCARAAVLFVMTAVFERSMWKYPVAHAYRVLHLDAGHLGQVFHLVCTALGVGPFTTAALDARYVHGVLGLDGIREAALYACAAGLPAESGGLHVSAHA